MIFHSFEFYRFATNQCITAYQRNGYNEAKKSQFEKRSYRNRWQYQQICRSRGTHEFSSDNDLIREVDTSSGTDQQEYLIDI